MSDLKFRVGDIVTRDGTDLQRVVEVSDGGDCFTVECIREPEGYIDEDGNLQGVWCAVGERESNLMSRYAYPAETVIENAPELRALRKPAQMEQEGGVTKATRKNWVRNVAIFKLREQGLTYAEIGAHVGVSGARTRQIIQKMLRMRAHPSREGQTLDDFFAEYFDDAAGKNEIDRLHSELEKAKTKLRRAVSIRKQSVRTAKLRLAQEREAVARVKQIEREIENWPTK